MTKKKDITEIQIRKVLDILYSRYKDREDFVSVRSSLTNRGTRFYITFDDKVISKSLAKPEIFELEDLDDATQEIKAGPAIKLYSDLEDCPEIPRRRRIMGGTHALHASLSTEIYNTAGLIFPRLSVTDAKGHTKTISNALIGTTHGLALAGKAELDTDIKIVVGSKFEKIAKLRYFTQYMNHENPTDLLDNPLDFAVAEVLGAFDRMRFLHIKGEQGSSSPIEVNPVQGDMTPGHKVKKYGYGTYYSEKKIDGFGHFHLKTKQGKVCAAFKHVVVMPGGFSCPGDSGAVVLDQKNKLVGMIFAGETKPCREEPLSYVMPWNRLGATVN